MKTKTHNPMAGHKANIQPHNSSSVVDLVETGIQCGDREFQRAQVITGNKFIEIRPHGYGEKTAIAGHGSPVLIEFHDGELRVVVFGDINQEDPTHIISLEGAKEVCRDEMPDISYRLQLFLDAEYHNGEFSGGISPTTLGTAEDSLRQMPDDVLAELLDETVEELEINPSIGAELGALIQTFGRDHVYQYDKYHTGEDD